MRIRIKKKVSSIILKLKCETHSIHPFIGTLSTHFPRLLTHLRPFWKFLLNHSETRPLIINLLLNHLRWKVDQPLLRSLILLHALILSRPVHTFSNFPFWPFIGYPYFLMLSRNLLYLNWLCAGRILAWKLDPL